MVPKLKAGIKEYDSCLAECSPGRPVDAILAAAAETVAKLMSRGKAEHLRIAKLLGQIRGLEKERDELKEKNKRLFKEKNKSRSELMREKM